MKWLMMVAVGLLSAIPVQAQDVSQMRGPAAERIEAYKKVRLMESLRLDEETSIKFFSRYNKHVDALREIGQKKNAIIDQMQSAVKGRAGDAEIEKIISQLFDLEKEVSDARHKFYQELREIMPMKKIAEYLVFERNFNRDLRDLLRDITKDKETRFGRRQQD